MRVRLQRLFEDLRSSFWFLPASMAVAGALLAFLPDLFGVSGALGAVPLTGWIARMGPAGAREVLGTVAGSAITVASVVFSISMVALAQASSQFGPRLLRNFLSHSTTQAAAGIFIGTFIYCLLVLAQVPDDEPSASVPHLSVAIGMALGLVSFSVLILFVQHVVSFIQASHIIEDVAHQLLVTLRSLFPERRGGDAAVDDEEVRLPESFEAEARPVPATRGYLQAVDVKGLLEIACERDLQLRLLLRPGHFAAQGQVVAQAHPAERLDERGVGQVAGCLVFGVQRTPTQDAEFAVDQLVEVAVRALSPGINDPFTATNCIDQLKAALFELADRRLPSAVHRDAGGKARVIAVPFTYAGIVDAAFLQIRQNAGHHAAVLIRLLEVIGDLARRDLPDPFRAALERHARLIRDARESLSHPEDRADVERRYHEVAPLLTAGSSS